jgi:transcriptional regulator with XRE-family HTH domain
VHPLRQWRREHDVTLAELAEVVAIYGHLVTEQHLSDIELGDRWPGALLAQAIQHVTGLSLEMLVTYRRPRRR